MAANCGGSFGLCVMRVTKLDAAGNVVNEAGNSYVSDNPKEIGFNPNIETGNTFNARNGCGCSVVRFKANDTFNWWDFTFADTVLEPILEALMLGQETIVNGADVVGVAFGGSLACDEDEPAVSLEFWTKHVVGSGQDGTYPWIHWAFPKTVWQVSNRTAGEALMEPGLTGFSRTNTVWGEGPYGDGPPDGQPIPEGGYWKTATDPPAADCLAAEVEPGS